MKKKKIILVGLVLLLMSVISITYAFFSIGGKQTLANTFKAGNCLNITIESESNAINLENIYPITDVEGLEEEPYTFTIKNTCSKETNYQINLESLNETTNTLSTDYVKVSLSSDTNDNLVSILSSNPVTKNYIANSYISNNLYTGSIDGNTTKTFSLRLWMDYDTTKEQGASKTYSSKINVVANPDLEVNTLGIKYSLSSTTLTGTITGSPSSATYCVTKDNVCTPNTSIEINDNKIKIELEESDDKQVVCTTLNNDTTICSDALKVTKSDFSILAMYQITDSGEYDEITRMPSESAYIINEEKSYCLVNGEKDAEATLKTINGNHIIANLQTGSNCYLYFDYSPITIQDIIANHKISTRPDFSAVLTEDTTGTIYTASDDDGTSYYYVGAASDNWVKFAGFYWRIIRINGDGTIRLIYNGTSTTTTGTGTQISTSAFNSSYNNNAYVGYMYTLGSLRGLGNSSTIKGVLDSWYSSNLLSNYASYIDTNAGFCGDRGSNTDSSSAPNDSGGTGTTTTYYAARYRLYVNKAPDLKCANSSDLYTTTSSSKGNKKLTYPIGLITADEVAYAGGVYNTSNSSYYLYTNQHYWTMSPYYFYGSSAAVFFVNSDGYLSGNRVDSTYGVRPVINLKADTVFKEGSLGTSTNPYIVVGAE